MRRTVGFIIAVICAGFLCACSQTEENEVVNSWDCTLTCAEATEENAYVITYSDKTLVSTTGRLTIENANDNIVFTSLKNKLITAFKIVEKDKFPSPVSI